MLSDFLLAAALGAAVTVLDLGDRSGLSVGTPTDGVITFVVAWIAFSIFRVIDA